jgi:hypothetical protein
MRQLGNAVPVLLARAVARGVYERLRRFPPTASNQGTAGTSKFLGNAYYDVSGHANYRTDGW